VLTDGSRLGSGAVGYSAVWQNGQRWVGLKIHMAYNKGAYDAEYAALVKVLETAARQQTTSERVTIFTDAQAAIICPWMTLASQVYAVQARNTS